MNQNIDPISPTKKEYRKITHKDTGGTIWGSLRSILGTEKSKIAKQTYNNNNLNPDGTWPEPSTSNFRYISYQKNKKPIGKLQRLISPNPDGSETLVFSLNYNGAEDVAHQAAHYLLGNLQAELGITNTVLYSDEIIVFALQAGLNIGNRPQNYSLAQFVANIGRLITNPNFENHLTDEEAELEHTKFQHLAIYISRILATKILKLDPQIIEPLESETIRYEQYIASLHKLQENRTVKANLLKKVKEAGTWEIPYGPIEGFKEFEFGEIPELTGDYSKEVAEINKLINQIDDRIKFKGVSKLPTPNYMKDVPKNPQAGIDARSKNPLDLGNNLFSDSIK